MNTKELTNQLNELYEQRGYIEQRMKETQRLIRNEASQETREFYYNKSFVPLMKEKSLVDENIRRLEAEIRKKEVITKLEALSVYLEVTSSASGLGEKQLTVNSDLSFSTPLQCNHTPKIKLSDFLTISEIDQLLNGSLIKKFYVCPDKHPPKPPGYSDTTQGFNLSFRLLKTTPPPNNSEKPKKPLEAVRQIFETFRGH